MTKKHDVSSSEINEEKNETASTEEGVKKDHVNSKRDSDTVLSENSSPQSIKPENSKKKRKRRSLIGRIFTHFLSTVFIILIFLLTAVYFLVDTQPGLKTLVNLANRYASEYVSIESADGRLGREFQLTGVKLNLPNYQPMTIPEFKLSWDYASLFHKKVQVNELILKGVNLDFTPIVPTEKEETPASEPFKLKELNIPINAVVDKIDIANSTLKFNDFYLAMNDISLESAVLVDNHLSIKNLIGDLQTLVGENIDAPFVIALNGDVDAPTEEFDLNLAIYAQEAFINGNELNLAVNTEGKGVLNLFDLTLNGRVDWANMLNDPILLKFDNTITDLDNIKSYLHVKNLSNQIMLNSEWSMAKPLNVDLSLKMNVPYLTEFHPKIRGSVLGDLMVKGYIMGPQLVADIDVENVDAFGIKIESLTLKGNQQETYDANIALELNKFRFDTFYLSQFGIYLDGRLTEEFDFDLIVKDLEREIIPENIVVDETTMQKVNIREKDGIIDEEIFYAENQPIRFLPQYSTEKLINSIEYRVKGRAEEHKFTFNLDSGFGAIQSDGVAALKDVLDDPTFTLYLQNSVVSSSLVGGDYKLNKPAYFYFRAKEQQFTLSSACYQQGYIVVCAEGGRSPEGINTAVVTVNNLPSALISDFLPPDLLVNTKANATIAGQFTTQDDFVGVVNVSLSKGDIRYRFQGREVLVPLDKTMLEVYALPSGVTSKLDIDWGKYLQADGKGSLTDLFKDNVVDANVSAYIPSFDWISPLIPALQDLGGEVALKGKVNGPVVHPNIAANFSIKNGYLYVASLNSRLKDINVDVNLKEGTPQFFIKGNVGTAEGTLHLNGYYNIANFNTELKAEGTNLLLANSEDIQLMISPNITFKGTHPAPKQQRFDLTGTIRIPKLKYIHSSMGTGSSVVKVSDDTIIVGGGRERERAQSFMESLVMNLNVILGDNILVGAQGLKAHLNGGLKILTDYGNPAIRGLGVINVGEGQFNIYGQVLNLDRGKIQFSGASITNPALDIQASRQFINEIEGRELQVGVKVLGSVESPKIELYSSPSMTDIEIASYLFLGRGPNLGSAPENLMLLNMVRKIAMGEPVSSSETSLASKVGLTDLGFMETPNGHIGIGIGKRFANSFYIGVGVGIDEGESTFAVLRYQFLKYFNINTAFMSEGESININYTRDY